MNPISEISKWKTVETLLRQAADLLDSPQLYTLEDKDLIEYRDKHLEKELCDSMIALEVIAVKNGCKVGFWRRMKEVAQLIGNASKEEEYLTRYQRES